MERKHVSRASIEIEASSADVWDALVNPATCGGYFLHPENTGQMIEKANAIRGDLCSERYMSEKCPENRLPEAGFIIPRISDEYQYFIKTDLKREDANYPSFRRVLPEG